MSATLPRIRIESRGGKLHIKADSIPKNFRKSATLMRYKKEPAKIVASDIPKTPKLQPKNRKIFKSDSGKSSLNAMDFNNPFIYDCCIKHFCI